MASSIHIKDDNYLSQDEDQMDDSNEVYNDYQRMQPKYTIWKSKAKVELKAKFADNLRTRVNCIENAVDKATQRIITDNLVPIMQYPEHFRVTTTIKHEALERMNHIIDGWGGVDIAQCEKLPTEYKRYWRLAHNWYVSY